MTPSKHNKPTNNRIALRLATYSSLIALVLMVSIGLFKKEQEILSMEQSYAQGNGTCTLFRGLDLLMPNFMDLGAFDGQNHFENVQIEAGSTPAHQYNYIFFVVDSWRWDHAPPVEPTGPAMPFLTSLIESGQASYFTNSYASGSWTMPTVSSLLTGVEPYRHKNGVKDLRTIGKSFSRSSDSLGYSMPENLRKLRGFHTVMISSNLVAFKLGQKRFQKILGVPTIDNNGHHAIDALMQDLDQGSDPFFAYIHINVAHETRGGRAYDGRFGDLGKISTETGVSEGELRKFGQQNVASGDCDFRDLRYRQADMRDEYFEQVLAGMSITYRWGLFNADEALRQLVKRLEDRNLLDNTIIFITSDHGESFYDDQLRDQTYHLELDGSGTSHAKVVYDELTRVPLYILHPNLPGRRDERLVSSADLTATVLSSAGVETKGLDGFDLLSQDPWPREVVISESSTNNMRKIALGNERSRTFFSPFEPTAEQLASVYLGKLPDTWIYPWPNERSCLVQRNGSQTPCSRKDLENLLTRLSKHYPRHPFIPVLDSVLNEDENTRLQKGKEILCTHNNEEACIAELFAMNEE